jgi:hypothetical protein
MEEGIYNDNMVRPHQDLVHLTSLDFLEQWQQKRREENQTLII